MNLEVVATILDFADRAANEPDFDFMSNPKDEVTMLNILLFQANMSAMSITFWDVVKYLIFHKWYIRRLKKADTKSKAKMVGTLIMVNLGFEDYVVPIEWHDAMIECFNRPDFPLNNI